MKKLIPFTLLGVLAFAPMQSCALFTSVDPTPAMLTLTTLNDDYEDVLLNFRALVGDLQIDPAEKASLLALLDQKDENRKQMIDSTMEWLKSLGDLDWVEWGSTFYDKFQQLREKIKEKS